MPAGTPQFFARANGARLWDVDGREYIDYACAYGPNLLGYGDPRVEAAAERQRRLGDTMTGPSPVYVELAEKLVSMVTHLAKLGSSLGRSIESYNEAIGSFEGRVMPAARRFTDLGVSGKKEIEDLTPVDQRPRELLTLVSPEPKSRSAA